MGRSAAGASTVTGGQATRGGRSRRPLSGEVAKVVGDSDTGWSLDEEGGRGPELRAIVAGTSVSNSITWLC